MYNNNKWGNLPDIADLEMCLPCINASNINKCGLQQQIHAVVIQNQYNLQWISNQQVWLWATISAF